MLHRRGIESIIIEERGRDAIEATIRAGVLEQSTVDLMQELDAGDRLRREGIVHEGVVLRFGGRNHRIDFKGLTGGRAVTLYPQHEVLKDLIAARLNQTGQIYFNRKATEIADIESANPVIRFVDPEGDARELRCDVVVGADGSYGLCRSAIPAGRRKEYLRIYPFGWFGILCEAPVSWDELIYARHERGFALISTRAPQVQRMYFQCDPGDRVENWSQDRIWSELQTRVSGEDGFQLKEGKIFQKNIVLMRSYVCEPMQYGRLYLAGDAAHVVPPTGAKGLNLAASDVWHLDRALGIFFATGSRGGLDAYSAAALRRVWQAQHFSWWMTSMLHKFPETGEFDDRRQLAELEFATTTPVAAALAGTYVGQPFG
jgi:p-hydroxybenzoate 3-monooxygenase